MDFTTTRVSTTTALTDFTTIMDSTTMSKDSITRTFYQKRVSTTKTMNKIIKTLNSNPTGMSMPVASVC